MKCRALLVIWAFLPFTYSVTPCAVFKFPKINDTQITSKENTTLAIQFELQNQSCTKGELQNVSIDVSKFHKDGGRFGTYCYIVHENGRCVSFQSDTLCKCLEGGGYEFSKVVDRYDNVKMVWSLSNKKAEKKEVSLTVEYPPAIHNLTLKGSSDSMSGEHFFEQGSNVDVTCDWKNGNPPVTARLLDRHEVKRSNNFSGQILYTFTSVGCQDTGLIHCQAPGASRNMTARLLVKCPPVLKLARNNVTVASNYTAELNLDVISHETTFHNCSMFKRDLDNGTSHFRQCSPSVNGTLPDLVLTVRLDNVGKEEEGQWWLDLTNDNGKGSVDFFLRMADDTSLQTTTYEDPFAAADAAISSGSTALTTTSGFVGSSSFPSSAISSTAVFEEKSGVENSTLTDDIHLDEVRTPSNSLSTVSTVVVWVLVIIIIVLIIISVIFLAQGWRSCLPCRTRARLPSDASSWGLASLSWSYADADSEQEELELQMVLELTAATPHPLLTPNPHACLTPEDAASTSTSQRNNFSTHAFPFNRPSLPSRPVNRKTVALLRQPSAPPPHAPGTLPGCKFAATL